MKGDGLKAREEEGRVRAERDEKEEKERIDAGGIKEEGV